MDINEILARLKNVKSAGDRKWQCSCPCTYNHAHNDKEQSLSVSIGNDGKILAYCHTGCSIDEIVGAIGCNLKDLMPEPSEDDRRRSFLEWIARQNDLTFVAVYSYCYGHYNDGLAKVRYRKQDGKKTFMWVKKDPTAKSGYKMTHDGCPHRLYVRGTLKDGSIYVVEGEKDADTIYRLTQKTAVSAENGAARSKGEKWREEYNSQLAGKNVYIIADNDKVGKEFAEIAASDLAKSAEKVFVLNLPTYWNECPEKGDVTDMVDAIGEAEARKVIDLMTSEAVERPKTDENPKAEEMPTDDGKPTETDENEAIESANDYIALKMGAEIENLRKQSNRKTGFSNLDAEAGSIYAGLYVVGGISSVGKTTFISQLADQMAERGNDVLFFSMEQSRLEMVSKSIARQTAIADPQRAVSSLQIRTGAKGESISNAVKTYTETIGDRISIIEGNFNCTVSMIKDYAERYMKSKGNTPVIVVDYLQVLQPELDPYTGRKITDTKSVIDQNITQLKRLSRTLETPVFVISSVNRGNYLTPMDFEAFKESGGIEYTADVVWGLQLSAIHDDLFNGDPKSKIKEKREKIARAKEAIPREIELVCLKNRYGKSRYTAQFKYYPQYDYFKAIDDFIGQGVEAKDLPWGNDGKVKR